MTPADIEDFLASLVLEPRTITVGGIQHYWTYLMPAGVPKAEWDGAKVVAAITPLIEEHVRFWGGLPFKKYAFLNIVDTGAGGGRSRPR